MFSASIGVMLWNTTRILEVLQDLVMTIGLQKAEWIWRTKLLRIILPMA